MVYEGASPDGLSHTVRKEDGTRLIVHDSNLRLKLQPDLSNIPSTPLAFRNEVNKGISKKEAQALARPRILTPIQQELMDWHHRLYHLSFSKNIHYGRVGTSPKTTPWLQEKRCLFVLLVNSEQHTAGHGGRKAKFLVLSALLITRNQETEYQSIR